MTRDFLEFNLVKTVPYAPTRKVSIKPYAISAVEELADGTCLLIVSGKNYNVDYPYGRAIEMIRAFEESQWNVSTSTG